MCRSVLQSAFERLKPQPPAVCVTVIAMPKQWLCLCVCRRSTCRQSWGFTCSWNSSSEQGIAACWSGHQRCPWRPQRLQSVPPASPDYPSGVHGGCAVQSCWSCVSRMTHDLETCFSDFNTNNGCPAVCTILERGTFLATEIDTLGALLLHLCFVWLWCQLWSLAQDHLFAAVQACAPPIRDLVSANKCAGIIQ